MLRITGVPWGNLLATRLPSYKDSNVDRVSIPWRHMLRLISVYTFRAQIRMQKVNPSSMAIRFHKWRHIKTRHVNAFHIIGPLWRGSTDESPADSSPSPARNLVFNNIDKIMELVVILDVRLQTWRQYNAIASIIHFFFATNGITLHWL